jgi:hypothetical protein
MGGRRGNPPEFRRKVLALTGLIKKDRASAAGRSRS